MAQRKQKALGVWAIFIKRFSGEGTDDFIIGKFDDCENIIFLVKKLVKVSI